MGGWSDGGGTKGDEDWGSHDEGFGCWGDCNGKYPPGGRGSGKVLEHDGGYWGSDSLQQEDVEGWWLSSPVFDMITIR